MAAKYCPTCQKNFGSTERLCPDDRTVLSLNDPYHLVGKTLLNKYRIDALVGVGGMGAVYYAYHSGIDRRVAFKILQPNVALSDDHVVEMFEREAKLAGRLSHENIADVTDAGRTDDGLAYIVMEWLEGRTLEDELLRHGRFGFGRAVGIARQVAAALGEAHRKHVIHRDLKPGNIMLVDSPRRRDHVKVLDFGIGKALEETKAGSMVSIVVGTPHYASPEQLTVGGRIDGRSDIYSLGVILYRMLSGKPPFNSSSMSEVIQMQLTAEPQPLSALRPETPPAIERLVISMLAKDPARRPQSADEVIAALDLTPPHLEKDDSAPTGETTIPRARLLAERTTEEMGAAPPQRGTFSTNVQRAKLFKPSALQALIIGATLLALGFGAYRYVSDGGPNGVQQNRPAVVTPTQAPLTAAPEAPKPSASVAHADAQSLGLVAAAPPDSQINPPPDRARHDDRRSADRRFEKARDLFRRGRYRAALRECDKALKLDPRHENARELKRQIEAMINILNSR